MSTPTVVDNPQLARYELVLDGAVIGHATYRVTGFVSDVVTIPHTQVDPAYRGSGYAGVLVRGVLDDVRRRGRTVVPQCPYVEEWMRRHPEYEDLRA